MIGHKKFKNVRISDDTYRRAVRCSKREQRGLGVIFDRAVDAYDKASRLESAGGTYDFSSPPRCCVDHEHDSSCFKVRP